MLRCPTCYLPTHRNTDTDQIEVTINYRVLGKDAYVRGWNGCGNCLKGLEQAIEEYMRVQRVNRGISLRAMEQQVKKKGCGCGG